MDHFRQRRVNNEPHCRIEYPILSHNLFRNGGQFNTSSLPYSFMHADHYDIKISRLNANSYLNDPERFLEEFREAAAFSEKINTEGINASKMFQGERPLTFSLFTGLLLPMNRSPWQKVPDTKDDYLTLHARDFSRDYVTVGVRHYIALDVHEQMVEDARNEGFSLIGKSVERAVASGVEKATQKQLETLEQTQKEKTNIERQMAELQRQLEALGRKEQKQIERQQQLEAQERLRLERIEQERQQKEEIERLKAERATQRNRAGYVYFVQMTGDERLTRIGRSATPDVRLKYIPKLPFETTLEHLIQTDDMVALERYYHDKYAGQRVRGDWFALSPDDLAAIKGASE